MPETSQATQSVGPSPLPPDARIADHWTVGDRWAVFGDVHFHDATSEIDVHVAAWRYQGSQPLPRFLDAIDEDRRRFTSLVHPQVCRTFDIGRLPNELTCYWVQESPSGIPLLEHLHERSVVVPDLTLHLALQIATGLEAIHRQGLVHGDLDPGLVRVLGKDRVKLSWAGLAHRLESAGLDTGRGTVRSMAEVAPETLSHRTTDTRSDVYGFAALLYRLLTGTPPFLVRRNGPPPAIDPSEAMDRLPAGVPPALLAPLTASLGRDPAKRPTMAEWLDALRMAQRQVSPAPNDWQTEGPSRRPSGSGALRSVRSSTPAPARSRTPAPARSRSATPAPVRGSSSGEIRTIPSSPPLSPRKSSPLRIDSTIGNVPRSGRSHSAPAQIQTPGGAPDAGTLGNQGTIRPAMIQPPSFSGTASSIVPRTAPRPPRGPSLASHLAATSLMALLVLAGVSIIATLGQAPTPEPEPIAAGTPPALPAIITLATHPPGATVLEGGAIVGTTPMEVVLDPQRYAEPREFRLELDGYAPYTVRQPWTDADKQYEVALQPMQDAPVVPDRVRYLPRPSRPIPPPADDAGIDDVPDPRGTR